MKNFLLIAVFFVSTFGFGQDKSKPIIGKDAFKINALFLIAGAIDVGYERVLNEESAIGVSIFLPITDEINSKFMLTPYYRYYFGQKPATGFYLEGFGSLNSVEDEIYVYTPNFDPAFSDYQYKQINVTDFAFGIGLGGKWISKKGVTFEINAGFGRNLFSEYNKDDRNYEFIGRGGISVGYRF
jgi:hypothetical protein